MLNVLIVDDSVYVGSELTRQLKVHDDIDMASTASSSEEAERMIAKSMPDVLVIDVPVNESGGFELLSRVRKNRAYDDIRVIVVTGMMTDEMIMRAVELGVTYCMIKPVNPAQLHERIVMVSSATGIVRTDRGANGDFFRRANRLLNEYGIMPCVIGHQYLRMALFISVRRCEQGKVLLTKEVYPVIAKRYNTSRACVERAIRSAISCSWESRDNASSHMRSFAARPRNGQFIAVLTQLFLEGNDDMDAVIY